MLASFFESLVMIDPLFTSFFAQVNYPHGNIGRSYWWVQLLLIGLMIADGKL